MTFSDQALGALHQEARSTLASALSPLPGPKTLLVDDALYNTHLSLVPLLDLFTDSTYLLEHGIKQVRSLSSHLSTTAASPPTTTTSSSSSSSSPTAASTQYVVIVRSTSVSATQLTLKITDTDPAANILLLMTPRHSSIVARIVRQAARPAISLGVLDLGFLPFAADTVTLDWPPAFAAAALRSDTAALLAVCAATRALARRMNLAFDCVRSAGASAAFVVDTLVQQLHCDPDAFSIPNSAAAVDNDMHSVSSIFQHINAQQLASAPTDEGTEPVRATLVVIDRSMDLVTPLLTQWTYEGLLDEAITLHNNILDLPIASIKSQDALTFLKNDSSANGNKQLTIRKNLKHDDIYLQIKDLNYWSAAREISSIMNSIQTYYKNRPAKESSEIADVKNYVKGLKQMKYNHYSSTIHTALASEISARTFDSQAFKNKFEVEREMLKGDNTGLININFNNEIVSNRKHFIMDCIIKGESLSKILRICCIWSLTSGGIQADDLKQIKEEMISNYGLGVLTILANLEKCGMLVKSNLNIAQQQQQQQQRVQNSASSTNPNQTAPPQNGNANSSETAGNGNNSNLVNEIAGWISLPFNNNNNSTKNKESMKNDSKSQAQKQQPQQSKVSEYSWQFSRAALRLVSEFDPEREVLPGTPSAISAPYSGYTPLTARLVEAGLCEEGWSTLPHIPSHQLLLPPGHSTVEHTLKRRVSNPVAVVIVVGGMVRAEISAVRMAAKAAGVEAIIATTAVMGPDEFVLSMK